MSDFDVSKLKSLLSNLNISKLQYSGGKVTNDMSLFTDADMTEEYATISKEDFIDNLFLEGYGDSSNGAFTEDQLGIIYDALAEYSDSGEVSSTELELLASLDGDNDEIGTDDIRAFVSTLIENAPASSLEDVSSVSSSTSTSSSSASGTTLSSISTDESAYSELVKTESAFLNSNLNVYKAEDISAESYTTINSVSAQTAVFNSFGLADELSTYEAKESEATPGAYYFSKTDENTGVTEFVRAVSMNDGGNAIIHTTQAADGSIEAKTFIYTEADETETTTTTTTKTATTTTTDDTDDDTKTTKKSSTSSKPNTNKSKNDKNYNHEKTNSGGNVTIINNYETTTGEKGEKGDTGEAGKDGEDGRSIVSATIDPETGNLILTYSDGDTDDVGHVVGDNGTDGRSIANSYVNEDGDLIVEYDDGEISNVGHVKGEDGEDGTKVTLSDNDTWVLDGVDTGVPATGKDGTQITISENNTWVLDGEDTGTPVNGKDGTQITISENNTWVLD
ncbi:MAG: hypothetical protein LUG16_06200, partial [Candidatus Gastranaerophilales bacterium]|nr:hypothetical protein [Candidatus Gastranaerophilales bacterium]